MAKAADDKLAELLSLSRELKGLTLRQLERRTGISNALLSQMETGKVRDPSFRNIVIVSRALGLSLERLADAACGPWYAGVLRKKPASKDPANV